MVTAPVRADRLQDLRDLLAAMNSAPGVVDPHNSLVPFGRFETIHVARFVVAEDRTLDDRSAFPGVPPSDPVHLIFLADCDGSGDELLARIAAECGSGLRQIFAHCEGFDARADLLAWMRARQTPATAVYVNWIGRTVRQVREEAALHETLRTALAGMTERDPKLLHSKLHACAANGPKLTPVEGRTPVQWITFLLTLAGVLLAGLVLLVPIIVVAPFFLIALRRRETTDPVIQIGRAHV